MIYSVQLNIFKTAILVLSLIVIAGIKVANNKPLVTAP